MQPPILIKVHKRSLAELVGDDAGARGEPPKMLCDPCGQPVFYNRLLREGDEPTVSDLDPSMASESPVQDQSDAAEPVLATEHLLQDIRVCGDLIC